MTNPTQPRPFNERAALEELERLAERIQASRREREQAVAEFDAFVKTFRDDQHATRLRAVEATAAELERHDRPAPVPPPDAAVAPRAPAADPPPAFAFSASEPHEPVFPSERAVGETPEPVPPVAPRPVPMSDERPAVITRSSSVPARRADLLDAPYARWILAAAGVLLVVLVVLWMRNGPSQPSQATKPPAPAPAAANRQPAAARPDTGVPAPVASSGPARALTVRMVTLRPVWARVTVDDKKVLEREIPGGQTIPLGADRSIAIRAGDAGAVRVTVDGKDLGPLGRDGQPATRTFSAARR